MAVPTFNGFSFNDSNWITERIQFRDLATRDLPNGRINRREGIKLLGDELVNKEISFQGRVVASSPSNLQALIDAMKLGTRTVEADLVCEVGRTFRATVKSIEIPDEHYNQSTTKFEVTFLTSDPYAEASLLTVTTPVPSGTTVFSGTVNISGTYFVRPTITYTPPSNTGDTRIRAVTISHTPTAQAVTITGFNSSSPGGLQYQNEVVVNLDEFTALDGSTAINTSGAFSRWEPGVNEYTYTVSGRAFPGGSVSVAYRPRYI